MYNIDIDKYIHSFIQILGRILLHKKCSRNIYFFT